MWRSSACWMYVSYSDVLHFQFKYVTSALVSLSSIMVITYFKILKHVAKNQVWFVIASSISLYYEKHCALLGRIFMAK